MEAALGWIGDVFRSVLRFLPHIILVKSTHEGVKWKGGRVPVRLHCANGVKLPYFKPSFPWVFWQRSGVHIYWAIVSDYDVVPIKRQTANLSPQYLITADKKTVGCSGILVYEVNDILKLLLECYDHAETIQDLALAAIKEVVAREKFENFISQSKKMDIELTKTLREQLRRFGIRTIRVTLSDFTETRIYGLWGASDS